MTTARYTLTFDEWRVNIIGGYSGCQDCIYDGAHLIDHCHNCCLAIIGDVWRHFKGQPRASRSQDAKVTDGEATLTLGPVAGVFAEATGDATAETDEIPPQRVEAPHHSCANEYAMCNACMNERAAWIDEKRANEQ